MNYTIPFTYPNRQICKYLFNISNGRSFVLVSFNAANKQSQAKESGLSPLQYQLERRLARAKNLLASSDMPVKDIAAALGFNSTWYFAHFFQKHMRSSPAAYRKHHRSSRE